MRRRTCLGNMVVEGKGEEEEKGNRETDEGEEEGQLWMGSELS